ncbi:AraC family transcriptional regulator [Amycolatopsis sp., V23-08]|uniref:AraC family transcriptional regulator n=1 Tax=Amycolatopsis heterodermiae TaxID=3110235 RepID=A0ABU5QW41_9PSEU|nr:AraC family transcriptional regulator [Amycolatopsis sp., V23-08]MEA5358121.1 AraC family transcriptional regulator [Amycolatopsis sp., V23-08]
MLDDIRDLIAAHAHPDLRTRVPGLLLSKVDSAEPHHSLTEPLLVVMAQGGKRLLLGEQLHEYRAGQYLLVTTDLPVTGHFVGASPRTPALGMGLELRPAAIAPLLLETPPRPWPRDPSPIATGDAGPDLLDATVRLLRLLDHPADAPVLAPLIEREILWRLLTGPHGALLRQIGLADSSLSHVSRAIRWVRENYAEPMRIDELARLTGMSPSAFHRHFRAVTSMSPLQFQKRIRLQEARSLLVADAGDVAGVGHLVGYDSPSQFNREYRRLFGAPPGQDAARLREAATPGPQLP